MTLKRILEEKNMSVYRLAQLSGVPYATANELCNQKANMAKSNAETVYRIAKALEITVEELLEPYLMVRSSFENFKSAVCHRLKSQGDLLFIYEVLNNHEITKYYDKEWYPESLYLLAMVDYLSRINNLPICTDYDYLRKTKLNQMIIPSSILALNDEAATEAAMKKAIPEFLKYNIVEAEVRNVI